MTTNQEAVLKVDLCSWYLGTSPCPSNAWIPGSQGHFSPMSLLMIYAWSLYVVPFDTNLELVHAGDREEQDRMQESLAVKGFT